MSNPTNDVTFWLASEREEMADEIAAAIRSIWGLDYHPRIVRARHEDDDYCWNASQFARIVDEEPERVVAMIVSELKQLRSKPDLPE